PKLARHSRSMTAVCCLLLLAQAADLGVHRFVIVRTRTFPLTDEAYVSLSFAPLPVPGRRYIPPTDVYAAPDPATALNRQRDEVIKELLASRPRARACYALLDEADRAALYWSLDSFLWFDEAGSAFRIDHWLAPLDDYLRACFGQSQPDRTYPTMGL